MSLFEVALGWLLQEHIKQDFNVTCGKRFMIKKDFRNRFVTQIVLIFRNILFWIYALNILELGTLLAYILGGVYLFINSYNHKINPFWNKQTFLKLYQVVQKPHCIFFILSSFVMFLVFKTYCLFDFFFILEPLFCVCILILNILFFITGNYLLFIFFLYATPNKIGKQIYYFIHKLYIYIGVTYIFAVLIISEVRLEITMTENFFKELLFKTLGFFI